jgi:hypothetical protein
VAAELEDARAHARDHAGTLDGLIDELGPMARAATAVGAAAAGDFVVVAVSVTIANDLPDENWRARSCWTPTTT